MYPTFANGNQSRSSSDDEHEPAVTHTEYYIDYKMSQIPLPKLSSIYNPDKISGPVDELDRARTQKPSGRDHQIVSIHDTISKDETGGQNQHEEILLSNLRGITSNRNLESRDRTLRRRNSSIFQQSIPPFIPPQFTTVPSPLPPPLLPPLLSPFGQPLPTASYSDIFNDKEPSWRENLKKNYYPKEKESISTMSKAENEEESVDIKKPSLESSEGHPPDLASVLSRTAAIYLDLDLLGNDYHAKLFGHLLDTIGRLQAQIAFFTRPQVPPPPLLPPEKLKDENAHPQLQIIHEVVCLEPGHQHHAVMFLDEPKEASGNVSIQTTEPLIRGEKPIFNLYSYLKAHPEICLILFKEHLCSRGNTPIPVASRKDGEHNQASTIQLSPRAERMWILSKNLQGLMEVTATYQPDQIKDGAISGFEMVAPYPFLFHHRRELASALEVANKKQQQELSILLDFIEENYGPEYQEAEKLFSDGFVTKRHIDKLFRPNQLVVDSQKNGTYVAYMLERKPVFSSNYADLNVWSWSYGSSSMHRRPQSILTSLIGLDSGAPLPIRRLSCYPKEYAASNVLEDLIKVGKSFWTMRRKYFASYQGWDARHEHHYIDARFMVDIETYGKLYPRDSKQGGGKVNLLHMNKLHDHWPEQISFDQELDEEYVMILPRSIRGFHIQEKKWILLDVANCGPLKWNANAFNRLVLNSKSKDMIKALVTQHNKNSRMDDIIKGKGNGLIILLHGSPGTGKTLTAGLPFLSLKNDDSDMFSSVAELAQKPLFRVTCGDIGTKATDVEEYLTSVLYLGKVWDCVLLLDEADVFLEERTMADLERNSLVSVFLRVLEYYEGILILTSNRVGTFDEAFKSRIQLALRYKPLNSNSRKQIWTNFFEMLEEAGEGVNMSELMAHLNELSGKQMNGREIRNALLLARQLSQDQGEDLGWEHLSEVIKTALEFDEYLLELRGHSHERWAREEQLR